MQRTATLHYSLAKILGVWAAAALLMATLARVVTPLVADRLPVAPARALLASLTVALTWRSLFTESGARCAGRS
jgi:hypothetical protein